MRVLVTGATGFLGTHLLERLGETTAEVAACVRSSDAARALRARGVTPVLAALDDAGSLRVALGEPTDCVFHVAADTSPWRGHAQRQTRTNVDGTRALLAAACARGVRRFVHVSSVSAYGQQDEVLTEQSQRLGASSWINYERTKALAEELVEEAGARGAIETMILNPAHILGPGDTRNWGRLILLVDQDKLPGAPPGSGAFADVREVARALVTAWQLPGHGERYLLGGAQASFLELVQQISRALGRKAPQRAMPAGLLRTYARVLDLASMVSRREPQLTPQAVAFTCHHLRVDCAKAVRELGYRVTPLDVLVADTVVWLRGEGRLQSR
ncbi:MAG: NAD-dependent epimerase/dehydratase family protein [Dokdonella sp.]